MFVILLHVVLTMIGGILAAGTLAWLSWALLRRTRFPGIGPISAFGILAVVRNSGDFTQILLMFSAIFAVGAFATLFGTVDVPRRHKKRQPLATCSERRPHLFG